MANYMYLFRGGHEGNSALSPAEMQSHMEEWKQWIGSIAAQGKFKAGEPLKSEVYTLKKKSSDFVTDGPFTETKEMVSGYLIVTADSPKQALEMAKGCPCYKVGGFVELREIIPMEM